MVEQTTPEGLSSIPHEYTKTLPRTRLLIYVGLVLVVLFHVWGNWYWITRNVTPVGRDAGGHLTRTLEYARLVQPFTWPNLFQAITYHEFRPPGLYLAVQIPYSLFGYTMDVAQSVNVFFLAVTLCLTFAFARRVANERVALLATLLTGFFPMMAALARYFYLDMFLTATIWLTFVALLYGEHFTRRRWALIGGAAVGVGMLVKWTLPAHTLIPILIAIWKAEIIPLQIKALRRPRVDLRTLAFALAGALVVSALLYLPNRQHTLTLPLGDWLFVVWVLLLTPVFYALGRPSKPLTNFWAGVFLAFCIASLWCVARIDFLDPLFNTAVGDYEGRYEGRTFNPWELRRYLRYPRYTLSHYFGPLGVLLLIPFTLWAWLRRLPQWRHARFGAWLLWGGLASTYLCLSIPSLEGERNLVSLIPIFSILLADSLLRYPPKVAWGLGTVSLLILGMSWSIFTFDQLASFHEQTAYLWPKGEFMLPPASGQTDPGYWLAPDVLGTIEESHDPNAERRTVFGMLINSQEIHRGPYRYLIGTQYPDIELLALTERQPNMWTKTIRSEWVLSKNGDNHELDPPALRVVEQVYEKPNGLFGFLYEPTKEYPLPNGETAILWRRKKNPRYNPFIIEELQALRDTLGNWLTNQPLLLTDPEQAISLGMLDLTPERVELMAGAQPTEPTIFLLRHRGETSDQAVMELLQQNYYLAYDGWFDSEYLTIWGRPTEELRAINASHDFGDARLERFSTVTGVTAGNIVPFNMTWTPSDSRPLKASFRLIQADQLIAQLDRELAPEMKEALFVPPQTIPGTYTLAVTVYDPNNLEPVADETGQTLVPLATVEVE
ncbi:MAG: ArnT family glycosyltransferase [Ardenticatenaceae bacterium]